MRNLKIFVVFLISGLFIVSTVSISQTVYKFNDGLEKAKSSKKLVLVNIYSESDTWCTKMDAVYSNENIKSIINSNFIYVKLNGQGLDKVTYNGKQITESELAKQLGVTGYPTHVFLNSDGSVIKFKYNGEMTGSFPGYIEANDFEKVLKYFANGQYKDTDLAKVF